MAAILLGASPSYLHPNAEVRQGGVERRQLGQWSIGCVDLSLKKGLSYTLTIRLHGSMRRPPALPEVETVMLFTLIAGALVHGLLTGLMRL